MLANQGKFIDRNPGLSAAGKLTAGGDHTTDCIKIKTEDNTPELVARLRAMMHPPPGERRTNIGNFADPELVTQMRHGVETKSGENAESLVNPEPKTFFHHHLIERKERVYDSKVKKPLGKSCSF